MTTINYNITVRQCSKGIVRIVGIHNDTAYTTCLTLCNGESISIYTKEIETKDIVPAYTNTNDYTVHITREVA